MDMETWLDCTCLYLVDVEGRRGLIVIPWNKTLRADPQAWIALQLGVTAAQVVVMELEPAAYDVSEWVKDFGCSMPKLIKISPETWSDE